MWIKKIINKLTLSQVWRAVFRHGWPNTDRNRFLTIASNIFLHLHPTKVKVHKLKFTYTFCLGGVSFLLFIILTITGVLLMFYYRPTIEYAYNDMKDLHFVVSYGLFLRNMHRWAAHGMVLSVILHMVRVFYTGAYKTPREFNWSIGVLLLTLTLFLSFTGYLLPWDQLAFWAVTIGANMAKATPFFGAEGPFSILGESRDVSFYLRGGTTIGSNTLLRFYVLHCVLVPLFVSILMAVHFWRVRKDGMITKPL
jgi:quinol-cytochrome oxidoreductase complex cytochrome b subunit